MRHRLGAVLLAFLVAAGSVGIVGRACRQRAPRVPGAASLGAELKLARPEGDEDRTWPGDPAGVEIGRLVDGGPAVLAGLAVGDRIRSLDGVPIWNPCDVERLLAPLAPGRKVLLGTARRGGEGQVELRLDDGPGLYGRLCGEGNAAACGGLAHLTLRGLGTPVDASAAVALYERACERGDVESCGQVAGMLIQEEEVESLPRAEALSQRACDAGNASGCAHLAYLHATGKGMVRDDSRATLYYQLACDAGEPEGCYNVGLMSQHGRGVPSDERRALQAYRVGCELGSALACTNLGFFHERGLVVAADVGRAAKLYARACEPGCEGVGDPMGCFNLGVLSGEGRGVPKDEARAAALLERACFWKPAGGGKGAPVAGACNNLGTAVEDGRGAARDPSRAMTLYRRACELGSESGCSNARAGGGG